MKKNIFSILTAVLLITALSSCKNEEVTNNEKITKIELKTQPLSINDVVLIADRIGELNLVNSNFNGDRIPQKSKEEEELQKIITPLIENGERLYQELIGQLIKTDEWKNLSENEKSEILNLSDTQKAQLSLIFINIPSHNNSQMQKIAPILKSNIAVSCIASALGISAINDIISGTAGLMTVESGLQLLKVMGKRYLGYIGLAIAVYEFVECVS